jgi:hypothetical protein
MKNRKDKVYISGGIRGYPDNDRAAFRNAAIQLEAMGYETYDPANRNDVYEKDETEEEFIRKVFAEDFAYICLEADFICMLKHWKKSKGALAEWHAATAVGIPVLYIELLTEKPKTKQMGRPKKASTSHHEYEI